MKDYWSTPTGFILRTSGLIFVLIFFTAWFTKSIDFEPLIGVLVTVGGLIFNFVSFTKASSSHYSKNELEELSQKTIDIKTFMLDRFMEKATLKTVYQKIIAMDSLKDIMVWKEEKEWLQKICSYLEQFENKNWSNRKFRILYGQYVTKPISIFDYFEVCIMDEPKQLYFTIKNIYDRLDKSSVSLLSVRDILEDYEDTLVHENIEHFKKRALIEDKFPHQSERDKEKHAYKPPTVNYKGLFPEFLNKKDINYVFKKMEEIRRFSEFLINEEATISFTHIVLSSYYICKKKPIMLITASNTLKDRLRIFSDIPVVVREEEFYYFGDVSMRPSTETIPHWIIHSKLHQEHLSRYASIIHIHNEEMTTIAEHSDVMAGNILIPTIPHYDYGTEKIGNEIANSMLKNNVYGVTVKAHGQWFVGESFEGLSREIINILKELRSKGI